MCKICKLQISSVEHEVGEDEHFIRFELLFNISFNEASNGAEYESPYYLIHCSGCDTNIGAKPVTLS